MSKKNIGLFAVIVAFFASLALAGFDKNPTSEREDRRIRTEASQETVKLLKQLVEESKRTNELITKLIHVEKLDNEDTETRKR